MTECEGTPAPEAPAITLTVCIPTLNRGPFIGQTLRTIVPQLTPAVELLIVDGGSTDDTAEVVAAFQERCPAVRYVRADVEPGAGPAPSNAGFDRDCDLAVELARGTYCWLMTDDDLLQPGAIDAVLRATADAHTLIVVNAEMRNATVSRVLEERRVPLHADRVYGPGEAQELFGDVGEYLSFVGAVVVRRDLWRSRERERYYGKGFIHVAVLFQKRLPGTALVLAHPWIVIRFGNGNWSARAFEIWMDTWPSLIWSFPDYEERAKVRVTRREAWQKWAALLVYRARGAYSLTEYQRWIAARPAGGVPKFVARVIASLPGWPLNKLVLAYAYLRRAEFMVNDLKASPFYQLRSRPRAS